MFYKQFHILALTIGALTHQTVAASFFCDQGMGGIVCQIGLDKDKSFDYYETLATPQCSPDGSYCVEQFCRDCYSDWWEISISNNGKACGVWCGPLNPDLR